MGKFDKFRPISGDDDQLLIKIYPRKHFLHSQLNQTEKHETISIMTNLRKRMDIFTIDVNLQSVQCPTISLCWISMG